MRTTLVCAFLASSLLSCSSSHQAGSCRAPNETLRVTVTSAECLACGRLTVIAQSPQISAALASGHNPCTQRLPGSPRGCAVGTIWVNTYLACGSSSCGPYLVDLANDVFAPITAGATDPITDTVAYCPFDFDGVNFRPAGNCVSSFANQCDPAATTDLLIDGLATPPDAGTSDAGRGGDGGTGSIVLTALTPARGATDASVLTPLSVTYSEALNATASSNLSFAASETLSARPVPGQWALSGAQVTFTPTQPLIAQTAYSAQLSGAIGVSGRAAPAASFAFTTGGPLHGRVDPGFGDGGLAFGPAPGMGHGGVLQPDGKLVAVGAVGTSPVRFALARYLTDGGLDPSFGTNGVAGTVVDTVDTAWAVALQGDGKWVVSGASTAPSGLREFVTARYLADGTLDPSFASSGVATLNLDRYRQSSFTLDSVARAVLVQGDGRIVVAGAGGGQGMSVVRYLSDGGMDLGFGDAGVYSVGGSAALAVAQQPDGKLVALGGSGVSRLNPDGTLDTSFNGSGTAAVTGPVFPDALALQPNGQLVVAGYAPGAPGALVMRFNPDGGVDPTFKTLGLSTSTAVLGMAVNAVAVQPDGRIVLAGFGPPGDPASTAAVGRLLPDGTVDGQFGVGGIAFSQGPAQWNSTGLDGTGRIFTVGGVAPDAGFAVGCLLP